MTEEPNRPLTPPGDPRTAAEMERPAPGPDTPGTAGSTFPRDDVAEGERQATDRPYEPGASSSAGGAGHAVDPGLADQAPEGPADRSAWAPAPAPAGGGPAAGSASSGAPAGWGDGATEGALAADRPYESGAVARAGEGPQPADDRAGERPADRAYGSGVASASGAGLEEPGLDRFREQWASVQGAFVDDPKASVAEADRLVGEAIQDLEQRLTRRRESLHGDRTQGEPDTEQLRRQLHSYRALFNSLLDTRF